MSEDMIFNPGRYSDSPASTTAPAAPAPVAPVGPTSPPVEPSKSREVLLGEIDANRARVEKTLIHADRVKLAEELHGLYQQLHAKDNVKKFELGRDPAAPPEPEPSTGRAWQPSVQPRGMAFDTAKLDHLDVIGRTAGFTPTERQGLGDELARSTHRASMPESARLAQTQRALEAVWGPKDSPGFQMRLSRATQQIEHLQPQLWDDAVRAGADLDAWVYLALDAWWTKAHPRP